MAACPWPSSAASPGRPGSSPEELLDDLDGGPVGDPLAVREAARADDRCVEPVEELLRQARLADAGGAEDRERAHARSRAHALPGVGKQPRLARPAHERCVEPADVRLIAGDRNEAVRGQRLGLAFRLERRQQLDLDRVAHEPVGLCAEQHLAGRGSLLETRRDVDRVAGDERVARARDDLAGVDADADLDLDRVAELDAARTARSASSSCTCGTPKTAMTASPMNFSTVPPCRSIAARAVSK